MRGEPDEVLPDLGGHLVVQGLLLRVGGAGEREVLPDQQPLLVAEFVEVVALVEAAAPDADQVDARGERLVEAVGDPLPGDPGGEAVVGDPVDSAYEDGLVVDGDAERLALQGDAPEARPADPGDLLAQADGDVVQGLFAMAVRPPGRGLGDGQGDRDAVRVPVLVLVLVLVLVGDEDGARTDHLDGAGQGRAAGAVHVQGDRQARHPVPVEVADDLHPGEARAGPGLQRDRPPDAGGDQRRPPVPAEVAGHLPDEGVRLGVRTRPVAELVAERLGIGVRGGEAHDQGVGALAQQRAHGKR